MSDSDFWLTCHELYADAVWKSGAVNNWTQTGHNLTITLNDPACNTYQKNTTHVWLRIYFDSCGSTIIETANLIKQGNTAMLKTTQTDPGGKVI